MGCDIHGIVEIRSKYDGKWYAECEVEHSRNYALFAALAGVRGAENCTRICDPRGIPADFRYDKYDLGDHSFTWLDLEEIIKWPGWDSEQIDTSNTIRSYCTVFLAWINYLQLKYDYADGVRLVIGFDN